MADLTRPPLRAILATTTGIPASGAITRPGYPVRVIDPNLIPDDHLIRMNKHAASRRRTPARAFTLVELLVVVAILLALAALVFGIAAKAQRRAKSMQCLSNLKEWAVVFQYAAADRNGRIQTPANWAAISNHPYNPDPEADNPGRSPFVDYWDEDLQQAFGIQLDRRHCPCQKEDVGASGNVAPTYMMNRRLSNTPDLLEFLPYQLDNPARNVLFIDGILGAPLTVETQDDLSKWIEPAADFHGGTVNAVYADLHVAPLKPRELEQDWKNVMTKPRR